jgi:raffinose/stachyose/melibiose transport system substrate-binding protein
MTVEGCGLIYNEDVLAKAGVDPASINTRDALKEAFKKVEAIGIAPVVVGPMDWSLGNHVLPIAFAGQSSELGDVKDYIAGLKDGSVDIAGDPVFNGLIDTLDVLKQYNYAKADPIGAVDYDVCAQMIANGDVAFYFQGNWTWPAMEGFGNTGFGYIPVPVSNDANDLANTGIQAGVTKYAMVDTTQNSEAQQAAAKQFLEWLVYSEKGQKALVQDAKIIMAFNNVTLEPVDPLAKSIVSYMKDGRTLTFAGNLVPADHWSIVGASMQKYLVDVIDRPALASDIMAYWAEK